MSATNVATWKSRLLSRLQLVRSDESDVLRVQKIAAVAPGKALDARLQQLGKPHLLKIYPPIGQTADDGHAFPFLGVRIWEPDVFAFLDEHMRR